MKKILQIEINQVANGFLVFPTRDGTPAHSEMHVFPTVAALCQWIRENQSLETQESAEERQKHLQQNLAAHLAKSTIKYD